MRVWDKLRRAIGFTMTEVLAALAIVGILLGVGIPVAVSVQGDLKLLELDGYARSIFGAAQNRLTALRAADALDTVPSSSAAMTDNAAVCYVTNDDGVFDTLLPFGAVDETVPEGGNTVIEYDPLSGSVYGVFYSESDAFTYDERYRDENNRARDERRRADPLVGYYGGDGVGLPESEKIREPVIELVNGEELYLSIDNSGFDPAYQADVLPKLRYTVTLTQKDDVDKFFVLHDEAQLSFDGGVCKIVLDNLTGTHFADVVWRAEGPALDPGADVVVTVRITAPELVAVPYESGGYETSSLFASRTVEKDEENGAEREIVHVSAGRHLQNLEPSVSGLVPDGAYRTETVVQDGDIDWGKYWDKTVTGPGSSIDAPNTLADKGQFVSIANTGLRTFDGAKKLILNLRPAVNKAASDTTAKLCAGLFAWSRGTAAVKNELRDINLVNPRVTETGAATTGTLAGYLENVKVTACRAYVDENGLKKQDAHGVQVTSAAYAGGLVGMAKSAVLEKSFAALQEVRTNGAYAGGLLGYAGGSVTTTQCYADTGKLSAQTAGGLIGGTVGGGTASNCYAVAAFAETTTAGGMTAAIGGGGFAFTDCYAASAVTGTKPGTLHRFAPNTGTFTRCMYLVNAIDGVEKDEASAVPAVSYADLKKMAGTSFGPTGIWSGSTADTTEPYDMVQKAAAADQNKLDKALLSTETYPFPRLAASHHYGDWPLPAKRAGGLIYYERYQDGTYGAEGYNGDGTAFPNDGHSLRTEGVVVADGYAVVGELGDAVQVQFAWPLSRTVTLSRDAALSAALGVPAYSMPADLVQTTTAFENFYQSVSIAGNPAVLWFNPHFARTVRHGTAAPAIPSPIAVRTARHLSALAAHGEYWTRSFAQQRDIDFATYTFLPNLASKQTPIGFSDKIGECFKGRYNGYFYTITGTGITPRQTGGYSGLFGYTERATLENIVFRMNGGKISGGTSGALMGAGALSTIRNCAVAGFDVEGTSYAGGLVGVLTSGTTTNSSASNRSVTASEYAGGIVGYLVGLSRVESSYALGELSGGTQVGGIAGGMEHTSFTMVSACYSACTASDDALLFGITDQGVSGCYYLTDTLTGTVTAVAGATGVSYTQLEQLALTGFGKATQTYPYAQTGAYPFPAVVKTSKTGDPEGAFVHYGDWPEKVAQPSFGTFTIGVAIKQADNKTYKVWGIDENGNWSGEPVDTITLSKEEYTTHVYLCANQKANGTVKNDWYVYNSSMAGSGAKVLSDIATSKVNYQSDSGESYIFYAGDNIWTWGQVNYFYNQKPPQAGNPPTGWLCSVQNNEKAAPTYQKNPNP